MHKFNINKQQVKLNKTCHKLNRIFSKKYPDLNEMRNNNKQQP